MGCEISFATIDERLKQLSAQAAELKDKAGWKNGFDSDDACSAIMETCQMVRELSAVMRQLATLTMLATK